MSENTFYVLLAQFDADPDPIPSEIWAFRHHVEAEDFLRHWSFDFLGGYTHDVDNLPPDDELVAAFRSAGAHVHLYACHIDGDSYEIPMFAGERQAA